MHQTRQVVAFADGKELDLGGACRGRNLRCLAIP